MKITFDEPSGCFLVDFERAVREDGLRGVSVPAQAIAAWSELLGYDDLADCLEVILDVRVNTKEPESDPKTGFNDVWTAPYAMLEERENAREREYRKAQQEDRSTDPRSPLLRSTLAAFHALPRDEQGVCALDRAREASRSVLGVPKPEKTPSVVRRTTVLKVDQEKMEAKISAPTCDESPHSDCRDGEIYLCKEDRQKCVQALRERALEIGYRQSKFLHSHTEFEDDPIDPHLAVEVEDEEPEETLSPDEIARQRYMQEVE